MTLVLFGNGFGNGLRFRPLASDLLILCGFAPQSDIGLGHTAGLYTSLCVRGAVLSLKVHHLGLLSGNGSETVSQGIRSPAHLFQTTRRLQIDRRDIGRLVPQDRLDHAHRLPHLVEDGK